ncbi:MAG TPA: MBL fold metallo-hydrolase [Chitinophagaceae bacterium]|nr:MBL fold metallo-hydrolase [Chitinophagaceae bacterium]
MPLKPARLRNEALLAEIEQYKTDTANFHIWWLGQSGYLLLWQGQQVLIDPYLSDSLTRKYAGTAKEHVRLSELVIDPALLKEITIVTSSHNHTDHLDGETLIPIINNNPGITFIIPEANRLFVTDRIKSAVDFPLGVTDGQTVTVGSFRFHGIPAKHNEMERDEEGRAKFMGYVISFGGYNIYHSGDTLLFEGIEDLLKPFNIDVALLPINGNDPARGIAGNFDSVEAVTLAKAIGAKMVMPCHYDMFEFNTADPAEFAAEAERVGQPYKVLEQGGHFSSATLTK